MTLLLFSVHVMKDLELRKYIAYLEKRQMRGNRKLPAAVAGKHVPYFSRTGSVATNAKRGGGNKGRVLIPRRSAVETDQNLNRQKEEGGDMFVRLKIQTITQGQTIASLRALLYSHGIECPKQPLQDDDVIGPCPPGGYTGAGGGYEHPYEVNSIQATHLKYNARNLNSFTANTLPDEMYANMAFMEDEEDENDINNRSASVVATCPSFATRRSYQVDAGEKSSVPSTAGDNGEEGAASHRRQTRGSKERDRGAAQNGRESVERGSLVKKHSIDSTKPSNIAISSWHRRPSAPLPLSLSISASPSPSATSPPSVPLHMRGGGSTKQSLRDSASSHRTSTSSGIRSSFGGSDNLPPIGGMESDNLSTTTIPRRLQGKSQSTRNNGISP